MDPLSTYLPKDLINKVGKDISDIIISYYNPHKEKHKQKQRHRWKWLHGSHLYFRPSFSEKRRRCTRCSAFFR